MRKAKNIDLVELIKKYPKARFIIDNDSWIMYKNESMPEEYNKWSDAKQNKWHESQELASSYIDNIKPRGKGYGSGCCYGGDILQALAEIMEIKLESV